MFRNPPTIAAPVSLCLAVASAPLHTTHTLAGEPAAVLPPQFECLSKSIDGLDCATFMWRVTNMNTDDDIDRHTPCNWIWTEADSGDINGRSAINDISGRIVVATPDPFFAPRSTVYLGTYAVRATDDAYGTFQIGLDSDPNYLIVADA